MCVINPIKAGVPPITLRPEQIEHVKRLVAILKRSYFAYDMSRMGAGKSITTSWLILFLHFAGAGIICPASLEGNWKRIRDDYGIPIAFIISYTSLGGRKGSQPKHGLLIRKPDDTFETMDLFNKHIERGTLLVFDEIQHIMNKSGQYHAAKTLMTKIASAPHKSRILMLSGSPIDKQEHAIHNMQSVGIIKHFHLYINHKETGVLELKGARELIDFCKRVDKEKTEEIFSSKYLVDTRVKSMCYELFRDVICPNFKSVMALSTSEFDVNARNHYFQIPEEEIEPLTTAISSLKKAVKFNDATGGIDPGAGLGVWQALGATLSKVENAKIPIFYRAARKVIKSDPNAKVVISCSYTSTIETLAFLLTKYNPIVLNGEVTKVKRDALIQLFQKPDTERRLIIANFKVISEGVDLDDKVGTFPRWCFVSPNYFGRLTHQLVYRFQRMNTKSIGQVLFVYGAVATEETSVIQALTRKSEIMKEITPEQVEAGISFPSDFKRHIEQPDGSIDIREPIKLDHEKVKAKPVVEPKKPKKPAVTSIDPIPDLEKEEDPSTVAEVDDDEGLQAAIEASKIPQSRGSSQDSELQAALAASLEEK